LPKTYRKIGWVFLGNIDPVLQKKVLDQIIKPKLIALDTMNFWIEGQRENLESTLKSVDLLIINETELQMLANSVNLVKAVKAVTALGPEILVIKRGEHGSVLYYDEDWFFVPGYPEEEVVDPTGAGDSFAGGFMGALAKYDDLNLKNLKKAMIYGSVMASYNITSFGPWRLAELSELLIENRFNAFRQLVSL